MMCLFLRALAISTIHLWRIAALWFCPGATPVLLLLTQHGSECDVSGVCYQAYFWADGAFRTADRIAEQVN